MPTEASLRELAITATILNMLISILQDLAGLTIIALGEREKLDT